MERAQFLNRGEASAFRLARRILTNSGFEIWPKPRLKTLIRCSQNEISQREKQMLWFGEPDFVVVGEASGQPEFLIELDSGWHDTPKRREDDAVKDRLCLRAGLPVLRIRDEAILEKEQMTALEWILQRFVAWRVDYSRRLKAFEPESRPWTDVFMDFEKDHRFAPVVARLRRLYATWGIVPFAPAPEQHWPPEHFGSMETAPYRLQYLEFGSALLLTLIRPPHEVLFDVQPVRSTPTPSEDMEELIEQRVGTCVWRIHAQLDEFSALRAVEAFAEQHLAKIE